MGPHTCRMMTDVLGVSWKLISLELLWKGWHQSESSKSRRIRCEKFQNDFLDTLSNQNPVGKYVKSWQLLLGHALTNSSNPAWSMHPSISSLVRRRTSVRLDMSMLIIVKYNFSSSSSGNSGSWIHLGFPRWALFRSVMMGGFQMVLIGGQGLQPGAAREQPQSHFSGNQLLGFLWPMTVFQPLLRPKSPLNVGRLGFSQASFIFQH